MDTSYLITAQSMYGFAWWVSVPVSALGLALAAWLGGSARYL